jgi:hypothetical protein
MVACCHLPTLDRLVSFGKKPPASFLYVPSGNYGCARWEIARNIIEERRTRVLFPGLVPDTIAQVDDLLASVVDAAGATQFPASSEVLAKRFAHGVKAPTNASFYSV